MLNALRNWVQRWTRKRATQSTDAYTLPPPITEPIPQEELRWLADQYNQHGGLETVWMHKPDVFRQIQEEYRQRFLAKRRGSSTNTTGIQRRRARQLNQANRFAPRRS